MAYIKKTWKDYPDTSTPITAEALQNIEDGIEDVDNRLSDEEIYTTATAENNGDFRVTLTNTTLTNGRVVKISFPTATVPASNARLSIDGGATYYPVSRPVDAVQLIVSDVAGKHVTLIFTGTAFLVLAGINLKGKSIVIRKNTIQSIPSATVTKLTFHTADSGYDPNVFALSNNDVVIKSKMVKSVACSLFYQTSSALNVITYIWKNNTLLAALGRATSDSGTMPGVVDNLALNDTISFRMWLTSAGSVTEFGNWNYAIVTVLDTYE